MRRGATDLARPSSGGQSRDGANLAHSNHTNPPLEETGRGATTPARPALNSRRLAPGGQPRDGANLAHSGYTNPPVEELGSGATVPARPASSYQLRDIVNPILAREKHDFNPRETTLDSKEEG